MNIAIMGGIIVIAVVIILVQPKNVEHTYEPATDVTKIRECVEKITGSPKLDVEGLSQSQQPFTETDVYRFCLKTVEDIEAAIRELAE